MSYLLLVLCSMAVVQSLLQLAHGHSAMLVPKPTFPKGFYNGMPIGGVDSAQFEAQLTHIATWRGVSRVNGAMNATDSKTLRSFLMKYLEITRPAETKPTKECGTAQANGAKQPLPDAVDFPWVHAGPCEVWCDNTRLFFNKNCQEAKVGKIPVDKDKCKGASFIQGLYVGSHTKKWQIYINCAPLQGGTETDVAKALAANAPGN